MFHLSDYKLKKFNFRIVLIIIALCAIGILVLNSAMVNDADRTGTIQKQILGFCVGGAAMIFLSLLDYHILLHLAPVVYLGVLGILGVILIPGVGVSANNAVRWLSIGGIQIQPSEFAKIGLGIACVIKELVQKELDSGMLVEIPLDIPIHRRTIGFAYHPANQAMALKTFLEFLY